MILYSLDQAPGEVRLGELLVSVAVSAANVVRDFQQNIRNLVGGPMVHYEQLIEEAVARALSQLERRAGEAGYDGVVGVKISHPSVVEGGVEVIVYGNGFHFVNGNS